MKIIRTLCLAWLGTCALLFGGAEPAFDPKDRASIQKEYDRIRKAHKNDPGKLLEEFKQVEKILVANSDDQTKSYIEQKHRLREKYGRSNDYVEVLPTAGQAGKMVDPFGWTIHPREREDGVLEIEFTLDKKDTPPTKVKLFTLHSWRKPKIAARVPRLLGNSHLD